MLVTKRRSVLAGLGGLALTGWLGRHALGQASLRVGVIGGGIVGTSIALNLAAAGARVTLFERTGPAAGATAKSFAWVNAFSDDAHYRMLRLESLAMWRKLDVELGLGMVWGGALLWQSVGEEAETLARDIQALEGSDYPLGGISADKFAAMASEFTPGNIEVAAYSPIDGHLDPVAVTLKLLEAAKFLGVEVKMPCSVEALKLDGDKLQSVQTCSGEVPLDRLVIAAGTDTPALTSGAGFTPALVHAPGILAHTAPGGVSTDKVVYGPGVHFKQFADGRIVGADSERPPDSASHQGIRQQQQRFPNRVIEDMHARRILGRIGEVFPAARGRAAERLTLGFRPMPRDGFPVVGYLPGSSSVYVAVMHSGVTLAPIMGRLVAAEVIEDVSEALLSPYRPDRPGASSGP